MDKSDKLIFFNKEGYPYNFQYNDIDKKWEGKLLFDENSNTLFKTLGLYIFEKVDSFNFTNTFEFESSQIFNTSGMTFIPETYNEEFVTDIRRVNEDSEFYTKWIYGRNFDKKFKPGTIITFNSGSTETTFPFWDDFINTGFTYFNVLGSKNNAILVETQTNNSNFINFEFETGMTISSFNIIKIPDYTNNYSDYTGSTYFNLYPDKKLNIVNSSYNDNILTYRNHDKLKRKVSGFNLSNELMGKIELDITLYTQRPRIYTGPLKIDINDNSSQGTEITFYNGISNDIQFFNTGQTLIIEDYKGNEILPDNPIFTIDGYKDKELIITTGLTFVEKDERNFIYINVNDLSGLTFADSILLKSYPFIENETLHNDRKFDIVSIIKEDEKIRIEVEQYVSNESGNTYEIYKTLKRSQIKTLYANQNAYLSPTGVTSSGIAYSTSNEINITQDIISSGDTEYYYENTINSIILKYGDYLNSYGIDIYHYRYNNNNYLIVEGLYEYNFNPNSYFDVSFKINNIPIINNIGFLNSKIHYLQVDEQLTYESIKLYDKNKLSNNFRANIKMNLNNDLINYGFKITLNSVEYFINYNNNTQDTINAWIEKYSDIFNKNGFNTYISSYNNEYFLNIESRYPNVDVIDFDVFVNTYSSYTINTNNNKGIVISSNQIKSIYANLYDLELSTGMIISIDNSNYSMNNKEYNIIRVTNDIIQLSYQGPFFDDYSDNVYITVNEYIRKPRSYYNKKVDYRISWNEPETGNIDDDIFFYDFSGEQLKPYNNISGLTYIGPKPLYNENSDDKVFLNRDANKFEDKIKDPFAQQTIFDNITYRLDTLNESDSYNYVPIPLEVYIGFYSEKEGVSRNELKIEKIEYSYLSGTTQNGNDLNYEQHFIISGNTISYITNNNFFDFSDYEFEVGQFIEIDFIDNSEIDQKIYNDYRYFRIKDVTRTKIFIDSDYSGNLLFFNTIDLLNDSGKTFNFEIKTVPREILRAEIYGQSENEDERLDINLKNLGIDIYKESEFIFKESDINEHSVDYIRLNRKRKEMLSIYPEIFNYIGSYKSLIHAIDYFGYNDLKLYEYYRNIKSDSPLYGKLQKILIPDIFDNSVEGWSIDDFVSTKHDKGYYKKTNLFNLTYRITDEFGNYSLQYSLEDVQIKLMALVRWLRKNIIPLSSNIRDITGVSDAIHNIELRHIPSYWATKSVIDDSVVGVNFYYTATKTTQKNYLFTINFYILDNHKKPEYFTIKIRTFSLDENTNELIPQTNQILYKTDYEPYTFNLNSSIDPYISIEVDTFNGHGSGYSNSKMFKYDIMKNYYLVNSNFKSTSFPYFNANDGYYIIDNGRYYVIKY